MEDSEQAVAYHAAGALTGSTLGGLPLLSLLGAGGMAEVYRSVDVQLQREVAVKVLPAHLAQNPAYVARFRTEAQRVASLRHPHVVPVFRFGEERGLLYLVMPLMAESLRDRMLREGVLEPTEAVRLVVQVAGALDAAHQRGLVHRDVKPENVLLDEDGQALLGDFGIAREVEVLRDAAVPPTLAPTGLPLGTPAYMAPEQLRGTVADQRVDIYGLGTVLFELLTGRLPHEGATPYEVVASILTELPRSPATYNPAIWPALAEAVLRALAPDPEQRYADMPSLVAAVRRALLDRETGTSSAAFLIAAAPASQPPAPVPGTTRQLAALAPVVPADVLDPRHFITPHWGITRRSRQRRAQVVAAAAAVLLLALGVTSGVLLTLHVIGPSAAAVRGNRTTSAAGTASVVSVGSPSAAVGGTPGTATGGQPTVVTATPVPTPTATPLLTPTITVNPNPVNFQASAKNCVATLKLTNVSAVDAQWSWTNVPAAGGWQYNYTGLNSTTWLGFPPSLTKTTAAYSSDYVYIRTGLTNPCTKSYTLATISVTSGTGTKFDVYY